jgi:putative transcriptional regulator
MESIEKIEERGTIDSGFVKKNLAKSALIGLFVDFWFALISLSVLFGLNSDGTIQLGWTHYSWVIGISIAIFSLIMIFTKIFAEIFVKNFSYEISEKYIIINHGIITIHKTTIPFSRIQNISVVQGFFDRRFGLYTVKVETAGLAGFNPQGGTVRPEGYMPGIRNPDKIEQIIDKLVHKYTQESTATDVSGFVFRDNNLAFDEFTAYLMAKIEEAKNMKTKVKELRTKLNLTQKDLAEKAGVSRQTINYLEQGKYLPSLPLAMKLAKILGTNVEELFQLDEDAVNKSEE